MSSTAKVALITGGASGMGYGLASHLAQQGWNVSVVDFNEAAGARAKQNLGTNALYVPANVAKYDSLASAFTKTWSKWGRLDLVWANAGIGDRIDFTEPVAQLHESGTPQRPDVAVVDICLYGSIYAAYLALHFFRKNEVRGGKLVITSSMAGLYPATVLPLYSAAKHGTVGLTRSLGQDPRLIEDSITVNCICPGLVPTHLGKPLSDQFPSDKLTPVSTIVKAIEGFIDDKSLTGQVAECSGESVYYIPIKDYPDEAAQYLMGGGFSQGTNIDPWTLRKSSISDGKEMDELLK